MNCEQCRELLSAFADGEADAEEAAAMTRHLDGCPRCRASLGAMRALKAAVRALPAPELPADLRAELLALARARSSQTHPSRPWLASGLAVWRAWSLAAACAAAGVLLIARGAPEEDAVPLEAMLAAHRRYALSAALAPRASLLAEWPDSLEEGDSID